MAAVKGVNSTKFDAGAQGDNAIARGEWNTRVETQIDTYEASALAAASTIEVGRLPAGAKVVDFYVMFDALGAGVTLALGDAASGARYAAAASASTAGKIQMNLVDGLKYEIGTATNDEQMRITTGGAAATGTITSVVNFTRGA